MSDKNYASKVPVIMWIGAAGVAGAAAGYEVVANDSMTAMGSFWIAMLGLFVVMALVSSPDHDLVSLSA